MLSNESALSKKDRMNIKDNTYESVTKLGNIDDATLARDVVSKPFDLNSVQGRSDALYSLNRLRYADKTPEVNTAIVDLVNNFADKAFDSGQALRLIREAYDSLPAEYKADKILGNIMDSASKANKKLLANGELAAPYRSALENVIAKSDAATREAALIDESMAKLQGHIETTGRPDDDAIKSISKVILDRNNRLSDVAASRGADPNIMAEIRSNQSLYNQLTSDAPFASKMDAVAKFKDSVDRQVKEEAFNIGLVVNNIAKELGAEGQSLGERVSQALGDTQRTAMLAGVTGRVKDVLLTNVNRGIFGADTMFSNLFGAIKNNRLVKAGRGSEQVDTFSKYGSRQARRQARRETAGEVKDVLAGRYAAGQNTNLRKVSDANFLADTRTGTRSRRLPGRVVSAMTQAAPLSTAGARGGKIARLANTEARRAGLKGQAADDYVRALIAAPNDAMKLKANDYWQKINLSNDGRVAKLFETWAGKIDGLPYAGGILRNQIILFGRVMGNGIEQAFTDRNMAYNVAKAIKSGRDGNFQEMVDQLGKLTTNTMVFGAAYMLWKSGVLVPANSYDEQYSGGYLKVGDRYIGMDSVPQLAVLSNTAGLMDSLFNDKKDSKDKISLTDAASNTIKQTSLSDTLGGQNSLATNLASTLSASNYANNDKKLDKAANKLAAGLVGGPVRQFIPATMGDINSIANTLSGRKSPNTKDDNPWMSELKKTQSTLWNASVPENPKRENKDLLDRVLNSTRPVTGSASDTAGSQASAAAGSKGSKDGDWYKVTADSDKASKNGKISREDGNGAFYTGNVEKATPEQRRYLAMTPDEVQHDLENGKLTQYYNAQQAKLDVMEANGETKEKIARQRFETIRSSVNKDIGADYDFQQLYNKTNKTEWSALAKEDPELANKLLEYDNYLADSAVSGNSSDPAKNKYYGKGGTGSRSSGGRRSSSRGGSGGARKLSVSGTSRQTAPTATAELKKVSAVYAPTIRVAPVKSYDKSRLKKISVSKGVKA